MTMERRVEELCEAVQEQVAQVLASGAYQSWADGVQLYGGDLVVFNNSFLFREAIASTVKNSDYLAVAANDRVKHPSRLLLCELGAESTFGLSGFQAVAPLTLLGEPSTTPLSRRSPASARSSLLWSEP